MLLAPLDAFRPFLLGMRIWFGPMCFIGSVHSRTSMGHGLGQRYLAVFYLTDVPQLCLSARIPLLCLQQLVEFLGQ